MSSILFGDTMVPNIGIMEKTMGKISWVRSLVVLYWGCSGIMEKKMETIGIVGVYRDWEYIGVILGQWKRKWKLLGL